MKEKSKEHSLKEMKLIMTCLTIICFCCTFITIFQNAILCFELGTNRAAIDAGKAAASEQFIWQAFPQGITLLSMAVCSVFIDLNAMAETFHLENDVRVSTLSRYPDVFVMEEQEMDEEELWNGLQKAICGACEQFVETRIREGENLKKDLCEKLDDLLAGVDFIEERSPQIMQEYRSHLTEKIQELLGDTQIDEGRIATEVTIYADKVCVDEETVRLRSHITSMKETLSEGGPVGRKLDFIAQEMNREANTILSKANNIEISDVGINLKTGIEKIREQIQNIE